MNKVEVAKWDELEPLVPAYALVANVDLVVIRHKGEGRASVLYGRCAHRGALMADGHVQGHNIICGVHDWDYRMDTGVSEYNNEEKLHKFTSWIDDGQVWVSLEEIEAELPAEGRTPGEVVPVRLHAAVTEVGTLRLEAIPANGDQAWNVEFDVRGEA